MKKSTIHRKGALASTVWTIIGVAIALVVAALIYAYTTHGAAGAVQLTIRGIQVSSSEVIVNVRNTGLGNVKINGVTLLDENGNTIRNCRLSSVVKNGVTMRGLPVLLRSGDTLTMYFRGSECQNAVTALIRTSAGVYKGIISS